MRRIAIPDIPDSLANDLITLESAKAWMKQLESVEKRLEEELIQVKMALKFVIYPRYNKLERERIESKRELEIDSLRNILKERKDSE